MNRETYESLMGWFRVRPRLTQAVAGTNKGITYAIYVAYPCLLVWLWVTASPLFVKGLLVPLISFVLLTAVRRGVNAPRPYEVFGIDSAVPRNKSGQSFPSRHAFSIFVIAMAFLFTAPSPLFGVAICVLGVLLATVRVLLGFHFPRDVIAGALAGIACGLLGFLLF